MSIDVLRIQCPVLAIGAERDHLVPSGEVETLAKLYDAEFIFTKDRGHNLLLEPRWHKTASQSELWMKSLD